MEKIIRNVIRSRRSRRSRRGSVLTRSSYSQQPIDWEAFETMTTTNWLFPEICKEKQEEPERRKGYPFMISI